MTSNRYTPLFRLSCRFLKYFSLAALGFIVVYSFSLITGISSISFMLILLLQRLYLPLAALLLGLVTIAIILESLR